MQKKSIFLEQEWTLRRFRREYIVEKSPDAVVNKRVYITVKKKNVNVLNFTVKRLIRGADIEVA